MRLEALDHQSLLIQDAFSIQMGLHVPRSLEFVEVESYKLAPETTLL